MSDTLRAICLWVSLVLLLTLPIIAAMFSPLLAWREPVYIVSGFAGIFAMALLLLQPVLAGRYLPNISLQKSRKLHLYSGAVLFVAILVHVGGLWITSPPDVIDALLLNSPTPFSIWGVLAMWAVFATSLLAIFKRKMQLKYRIWRISHISLAITIVVATIVHAYLIEGTMETWTKLLLSLAILGVTARLIFDVWRKKR